MTDILDIERRHSLVIKIGADTWESLIQALRNIEFDLMRHDGTDRIDITSGGPDSGYVVLDRFDGDMTHEAYFKYVDEWLEAERSARLARPAPDAQEDGDG